MNPQVLRFAQMIGEKLPNYGSVAKATAALTQDLQQIMGDLSPEMVASISAASAEVESKVGNVEILHRNSLIKPRDNWYGGPSLSDQHWPALKGYLGNEKKWDEGSVNSIHESSTEVVSLLANPHKDQFRCRGLVVGYVQSGKTANMTAVIAKAVDAGYNLIVLLGGVNNKLRAQTQNRIVDDIVERHRPLWQLYTTAEDNGDFSMPANGQFTMPVAGRAQLVVMKKWKSRLEAFLKTVERTPPAIMRTLKTLIIDDECDQASVNTADEDDVAQINWAIRRIIHALPAVSYVGYTATPFANVFINPSASSKTQVEDLYPEDFITALPRPNGYFGTREVFGFDPDDADNDTGPSAGRNMLRPIPLAEVSKIRPSSAKDKSSFTPTVTQELENALFWFLLSCAVRRRRGQASDHMTMLIHTSQFVDQHTNMANGVRAWLIDAIPALKAGNGEKWDRADEVWNNETAKVPLEGEGEAALTMEDLKPWLAEVTQALEIAVENGESNDRLEYGSGPKTYIVVGGSVLARGLTLEGLSVSFFLRTSQQYDTLLQMGRWFGFRRGYVDLPRLWATQDLISSFRSLAHIEDEIRDEINLYRERKATPLQFAVKVRAIPGMAITSASKMRHAYRTSISFAGKHIQTIRFNHTDINIIRRNWAAASKLVDDARSQGQWNADDNLATFVPNAVVRRFLMDYDICGKHLDLKKEMLIEYIDKASTRCSNWNVAVIAPKSGNKSNLELGSLGTINTNRRSRLAEPSEYADIKALMSKGDVLIDVEDKSAAATATWEMLKARRQETPLLLLYPINAESQPKSGKGTKSGEPTRVALDAADDLIGIGIVFPGAKDQSGNYFSIDLDVPTPEQLDDEEQEASQ